MQKTSKRTLIIFLLGTLVSLTNNSFAGIKKYVQLNSESDRGYSYSLPKKDQILEHFGTANCRAIQSDILRVFVWNMFKGDKTSWSQDFLKLTRDKDIILMQEVYLNKLMSLTFDQTPYDYFYAKSFIYLKTKISTGIATASKCSPIKTIPQRSRSREPLVSTPKMVLISKFKTNYGDLLVLNIHAINFVSSIQLFKQLNQAYLVAKNHNGPMIFAGDFNAWSFLKNQVVKNLAIKLKLKFVKFTPDLRMKTFGYPLDFFMYRGFDIVKSKIWGKIDGSDHKAMDVILKFKK